MDERFRELGQQALASFDRLAGIEGAPSHDELTSALRDIVILRDALIAAQRASGPDMMSRQRLDDVNSILSAAKGAAYPLVGVRPERIRLTRDALRRLVGAEAS